METIVMEFMANNLPLYYEEYGTGKPILCLHGFSEDSTSMKGCIEPAIKKAGLDGYRRIYLDIPGMGKTPGSPDIKNADDMLDVLKQFIAGVIGDEGFLLVGNSYGGYMSLGLAADNANINGLFLFGPCMVADFDSRILPDVEDDELYVEDGLEDEFEDNEDFEDFLETAVYATREVWHRYESEILPAYSVGDKAFRKVYRENGYALTSEPQFSKMEFTKPITVLVGKQDESVGYEDAWNILKHLPKLTYCCLNGTGHLMQIEKPEMFELIFKDWITAV